MSYHTRQRGQTQTSRSQTNQRTIEKATESQTDIDQSISR